jgi:hypothetical protein
VGFLHARETMEVDRKKQPNVNSLWPNPWLLIALHSPYVTELWLLMDRFEYKTAHVLQKAS